MGDPVGHWDVKRLGYVHGQPVVNFRNVASGEYLFAGVRRLDPLRRYSLTWIPGLDAHKDPVAQWKLTTINRFHGSSASVASVNGTVLRADVGDLGVEGDGNETSALEEFADYEVSDDFVAEGDGEEEVVRNDFENSTATNLMVGTEVMFFP